VDYRRPTVRVGIRQRDTEVAVARQPSGTGSAEESEARLTVDDDVDAAEGRSAATDKLWSDVRVEPVEIALPKGVGYTLRAYRLSSELSTPEIDAEDDDFPTGAHRATDDSDEEPEEFDEAELTELALAAGRGRHAATDAATDAEPDGDDDDGEPRRRADGAVDDPDAEAAAAAVDDEDDEDDEKSDEDDSDDAEAAEPEEIPVFLAQRGRLPLFASAEGLVEFVRSDAEHDLRQLDTWEELQRRLEPADVVPLPADRYELDLVVENLRGGHDVWDPALLVSAGDAARDLGYALRIQPVMAALAPGSPMDDLDESLRKAADGGVGAFFARRKMRRKRAEESAIGWRTIIGKISARVDWRD
jgi:hypothetical protein